MRSPAVALAATALLLSACSAASAETTFQDLRNEIGRDLDREGVAAEEITCAMDAYEASVDQAELDAVVAAYDDGGGDSTLEALAESVGEQGVLQDCFSAETFEVLMGAVPEEDARDAFIVGFLDTAPTGTTEEQAICVFDDLIAGGANLLDATPDEATNILIAEAVLTCGIPAPTSEDMAAIDPEVLRQGFASGIAVQLNGTTEQGLCVHDELIAAGHAQADFLGDVLTTGVEEDLAGVLATCGLA